MDLRRLSRFNSCESLSQYDMNMNIAKGEIMSKVYTVALPPYLPQMNTAWIRHIALNRAQTCHRKLPGKTRNN